MSRRRGGLALILLGPLSAAMALGACRQATGLDQFEVQCVAGEPDCPDPDAPEDCVSGRDSNGDGVFPAACSGTVVWLRQTPGTVQAQCQNDGFLGFEVDPDRRLVALQSFGMWGGAAGSVRGTLGPCEQNACGSEAHGLDGGGDDVAFEPALPCQDDTIRHALARGRSRAYAASVVDQPESRQVVLSAHRLEDASFASRWEWTPPGAVTSFALAADTAALVAVGQGNDVLFAEPDDAFPGATFRVLTGAHLASIALGRAAGAPVLLLAGVTVDPAGDPGPCGLGATTPTAFVARAPLEHGATDVAAPTPIPCDGFPLKLALGKDTKSPSLKIATNTRGRACWAFLGSDDGTDQRRLQTGCFDLETATFSWQRQAVLGNHDGEPVDLALDPFGHVLVTAVVRRSSALPLWDGTSVELSASDAPNLMVLKLDADTGKVIWAHMFAAPGGNARNPHVAVDDDGMVRFGAVTDGQALSGSGLGTFAGVSGFAVHLLGMRP